MTHARGWLAERVAEGRIAVMTLTRLPAGRISDPVPTMAASAWAFPLVGGLIGALSAASYAMAFVANLPPSLAALIAIATAILATGALHEDGLADLADGLGGGIGAERKLEIMRDSRVGTYGLLALILAIAMRTACLAAIAAPWAIAVAILAVSITSRSAVVVALRFMPPARATGLGQTASGVTSASCLFATLTGLVVLALLFEPLLAAKIALIMAVTTIALAWMAWRQIGGQTGDVLGAIQR